MSSSNDSGEKSIEERLSNESFKVKRILLELPNFAFYHSVLKGEASDINDRFVGRKHIIDRIRSFIYDTTKNTGTYLITGFRGMGKTSVVNKALDGLNPHSKFKKFFYLWIITLTMVFFYDPSLNDYIKQLKQSLAALVVLIGFLVLVPLYLGYRSPGRLSKTSTKSILLRPLRRFKYGMSAIFNPKFQKHKYSIFRVAGKFYQGVVFFLLMFVMFELKEEDITTPFVFTFFWYSSLFIVLVYMFYDLYEEFVLSAKERVLHLTFVFKIYHNCKMILLRVGFFLLWPFDKYEASSKSRLKKDLYIRKLKLKLVVGLIVSLVSYHYLVDCYGMGVSFLLFGLIYVILKYQLKSNRIKKSSQKHRTVLSRIATFVDLQQYITVNVNLGKDKLTEKDVLKYICNETLREYKKWFFSFRSPERLVNTCIIFFIFLLLAIGVSGVFVNRSENFSSWNKKISHFFPSQRLNTFADRLDFNDVSIVFSRKENEDNGKTRVQIYNEAIQFVANDVENDNNVIGYQNLKEINNDTLILNNGSLKIINEQSTLNVILTQFGHLCNQADYVIFRSWFGIQQMLLGKDYFVKDYIRPVASASTPSFNTPPSQARSISTGSKFLHNAIKLLYPRVPNYWMFLLLLMVFFLFRFLPGKYLLVKTHFSAIRDLKQLKNQIDSSIVIERGGTATAVNKSIFNYVRKTSVKPLESKDITQRLIHILDDISDISSFFIKVRFIFVFDELDKISTHHNSAITSKEDEFDLETDEIRYQARRKERIGMILSSMKHFLNSAHAKFIFIAGREMYDAALAGISDRESNLDSIFNDNKIYVKSFYAEKEDITSTDFTTLTEQYLFQFMLPASYISTANQTPTLKLYVKYLNDHKSFFKLSDKEIHKITITLKDFVVYLAYRSNGAPRKLASLIENFITPVSGNDIQLTKEGYRDSIVVNNNNENLYIKFRYYDQYKFALIANLVNPVFLKYGNFLHEYSDKILISISYMLDHIFKHHKFGLSYRNLALTPEIVDITKEPQFREFLDNLIMGLSRTHLRPILSGIYDMRFHSKIAAEIKFLSKIDEFEAAAFNFTLDESIELKRHFNRRLESLKKEDANLVVSYKGKFEEDHINSVSLLHMMIGDLHFYDEEYQEAIVHYLDGLQIIRQKHIKDMTLYEFVNFVRNKLKLGLSFEKNKMYDNALMTFAELTDLIIRKRNIPLREFGLARFIVKNEILKNSAHTLLKSYGIVKDELEERFNQSNAKEILVYGRLNARIIESLEFEPEKHGFHWNKIYDISALETFYCFDSHALINQLDRVEINFKPLKRHYLQSTGENIRLLYQPLIAKLYLIEKTSPDKLKDIDVCRAIDELKFLTLPLRTNEKRVIVAEFYNKLGDLMYVKNGTLNHTIKEQLIELGDLKSNYLNQSNVNVIAYKANRLIMSPLDALVFYVKSLAVLLIPMDYTSNSSSYSISQKYLSKIDINVYYNKKRYSFKNEEKDFGELLEYIKTDVIEKNLRPIVDKINLILEEDNFKLRYTSDYLHSVANGTIDMANTLLSFTSLGKSNNVPMTVTIDSAELGRSEDLEVFNTSYFYSLINISLFDIIKLYSQASLIFEGIGEYRLAKSQLLKIFFLFKNASNESITEFYQDISLNFATHQKFDKEHLTLHNLLIRCNGLIRMIDEQTNNLSRSKHTALFSEFKAQDISKGMSFGEQEVLCSYYLCIMRLLKSYDTQGISEEVICGLTEKSINDLEVGMDNFCIENSSPYSQVTSKFNRVLLLSMRLNRNKRSYLKIKDDDSKTDDIMILLIESIGLCNELIKIHSLFGMNYVTSSNIDLARAHYLASFWCKEYNSKKIDGLEDKLRKYILNTDTTYYLDYQYHITKSIEYNKRVKDFHTRGAALKTFIQQSSYLDDFYNDNLVHFAIGTERNALHKSAVSFHYPLNIIDEYIKQLEEELKNNLIDDNSIISSHISFTAT